MKIILQTVLFLLVTVFTAGAQIKVATDGSGDFKSVQSAIDKVPEDNHKRFTINISPGVYDEQIRIPANKPYISLVGTDPKATTISFSLSNKKAGSTSAAYAVYIGGHDFHAEGLTFENSFGQGSQAVAVLAEADRVVFKNCRFLGWQDTLYAKNGRQFYDHCYIEGHVDFIFGEAAAFFSECEIHSKGDGFIAAPMRFSEDEPSGFVFNKCRLTSENIKNGVYLARPWRDYGRTIYIDTEMGSHIRPEGWNHWQPKREKTAFFAEYGSTGAGANIGARVSWAHKLTKPDLVQFSVEEFLKGRDGWNAPRSSNEWLEQHSPDWSVVTWQGIFSQKPLWYQTDEAARIADQIVLYQKSNGGWEKNIDMAAMLTEGEKRKLAASVDDISETTIDNRTSYTQVDFLGKIITASAAKSTPPNNFPKYKDAFNRGLDYLLSCQYDNGGFPQFYPLKKGYYTHITFNDDAMIGVLEVFRKIARGEPDFKFVDENRRLKSERAIEKAIPLILKLQMVVNGKKTIWIQQYEEKTLQPAWARKFEPPALSAGESAGIVRFLMGEPPTPEIRDAVDSAVTWFKNNEIMGIRWVRKNGENSVVPDKNAPPIWARFYEIETMKPIFVGRDSVIRYDVAQIESERRNGYAWYGTWARSLIEKDYSKWKAKSDKK